MQQEVEDVERVKWVCVLSVIPYGPDWGSVKRVCKMWQAIGDALYNPTYDRSLSLIYCSSIGYTDEMEKIINCGSPLMTSLEIQVIHDRKLGKIAIPDYVINQYCIPSPHGTSRLLYKSVIACNDHIQNLYMIKYITANEDNVDPNNTASTVYSANVQLPVLADCLCAAIVNKTNYTAIELLLGKNKKGEWVIPKLRDECFRNCLELMHSYIENGYDSMDDYGKDMDLRPEHRLPYLRISTTDRQYGCKYAAYAVLLLLLERGNEFFTQLTCNWLNLLKFARVCKLESVWWFRMVIKMIEVADKVGALKHATHIASTEHSPQLMTHQDISNRLLWKCLYTKINAVQKPVLRFIDKQNKALRERIYKEYDYYHRYERTQAELDPVVLTYTNVTELLTTIETNNIINDEKRLEWIMPVTATTQYNTLISVMPIEYKVHVVLDFVRKRRVDLVMEAMTKDPMIRDYICKHYPSVFFSLVNNGFHLSFAIIGVDDGLNIIDKYLPDLPLRYYLQAAKSDLNILCTPLPWKEDGYQTDKLTNPTIQLTIMEKRREECIEKKQLFIDFLLWHTYHTVQHMEKEEDLSFYLGCVASIVKWCKIRVYAIPQKIWLAIFTKVALIIHNGTISVKLYRYAEELLYYITRGAKLAEDVDNEMNINNNNNPSLRVQLLPFNVIPYRTCKVIRILLLQAAAPQTIIPLYMTTKETLNNAESMINMLKLCMEGPPVILEDSSDEED